MDYTIRTIHPESGTVSVETLPLLPTNEQGNMVCGLWAEFLAARPTAFKEPLVFLKKHNFELEWAAEAAGVAYAAFYESGVPVAMCVLLLGLHEEQDELMLQAIKAAILGRLLGGQAEELMRVPERPAMLQVMLPGTPELVPTVQLLSGSLASVYFRCMIQLVNESQAGA